MTPTDHRPEHHDPGAQHPDRRPESAPAGEPEAARAGVQPDLQPDPSSPVPRDVLARGSWDEHTRIEKILAKESAGGIALIVAAALALLLANTGAAAAYTDLRDAVIGPENLFGFHLNLSIGTWAADGLLAIFFFLVGLELKKEFTQGDLRDPKRALVPVAAAFGGVAVPAIVYVAINASAGGEGLNGWAIPTATDIAFAVAVLAVIGAHLPPALRTFLLTLAIVDDLIAITIIAVFYSSDLQLQMLALALIPIVLFAVIARRGEIAFKKHRGLALVLLLPLAVIAWVLFHESGVHATIAGVILAFTIPTGTKHTDDPEDLESVLETRLRPISAGFAVPIFAFFSAGVTVGGLEGLTSALTHPVAIGIIAGLVIGKIIGITGVTFLITRLRHANLDPDIRWIDLVGVAAVAGIGFTVSLLVTELSFGAEGGLADVGKVGVLTASVLAAAVGAIVLIPRNRRYRKLAEQDAIDLDQDEIPDLFESPEDRRRRSGGGSYAI